MASPQAGPYAGAERLDPAAPIALAAAPRRAVSRPSARRRTSAAVTNGMSQATQTTGAGAATTAV